MIWKDKIDAFNRRWNITPTADSPTTFFEFKTRIVNVLQDIDSHVYPREVGKFCKIFSISYQDDRRGYIVHALSSASSLIEMYKMLEIIFAFDVYDNGRYIHENKNKGWYLQETKEAFDLSNVQARIVLTKQDEIIIAPAGEHKLDEELTNLALSFLGEKSNSHLVSALGFFEEKKWVKCSEGIRRSLEEYLREKLENNVGLSSNITEVGKTLKAQKSPTQVRNIIMSTFSHLDHFFNENSKHNDGDLEEADAEFLIYQTTLLMRYIEKHI